MASIAISSESAPLAAEHPLPIWLDSSLIRAALTGLDRPDRLVFHI